MALIILWRSVVVVLVSGIRAEPPHTLYLYLQAVSISSVLGSPNNVVVLVIPVAGVSINHLEGLIAYTVVDVPLLYLPEEHHQ